MVTANNNFINSPGNSLEAAPLPPSVLYLLFPAEGRWRARLDAKEPTLPWSIAVEPGELSEKYRRSQAGHHFADITAIYLCALPGGSAGGGTAAIRLRLF